VTGRRQSSYPSSLRCGVTASLPLPTMVSVTDVKVRLAGWEFDCCGDVRRVGDTVAMSVFCEHGELVEQLHELGDLSSQRIMARILEIEWRPALIRRASDGHELIVGYGLPVELMSTDDRPAEHFWAFDFTVQTEDELPHND
jgi:hypothetical protein